MRHSCLFAAISFAFLSLGGCGMEDTGPSAFNPATNVDLGFSSFTLTEEIDTTLFYDLFAAVEPADSSDAEAQATAAGIRSQLSAFLGLKYSTDPELTLESVRNPLDLMRRVVGENSVRNFNDGRQYISSRIDNGLAGEYNNKTNGVYIRFSDKGAAEEGLPISQYEWIYPIVKWVYTPGSSNRVIRIINWVASGSFAEGTTRPSATLGTESRPRDFQPFGYNDGARLHSEGSIVIEGEREMSFVREYEGLNTDSINIDGTAIGTEQGVKEGPEFSFAGATVDCLKIEMNYATQLIELFTSRGEPPQIMDPANPDQTISNPAYCLNLESPTKSYQTKQTGLRM